MNRHSADGNHETISRSHHKLVEEIAQLKERERVLISENDQLRAQLVEMKDEAHRKYDDLMVQYNMKREYEDDGTSNNQVTVKTESDDDEVKEVIKVEIKEEEDEENHDIFIKREYVPTYIKTELSDMKVEIKEEDDNDEDSDWERRLVKKELNTADMIEIKEEVEDGEETRIIDMETLTEDRQVKREIEQEENEMTFHNDQIGDWVKQEMKEEEEDGEMVDVKEEVEDGKTQVDDIEGWAQDNQGDDDDESVETAPIDPTPARPIGQYHNVQNASNSNESIEVCVANLSRDQHNTTTLNEPNEVTTVTQSADLLSPSTSTGNGSNQTALNQQANATTQHNKRKQAQTKRSVKRSKKTLEKEDGEDGGDIANVDPEESKVKVVYLNCTESNCNVKMTSLAHLHNHLSTVHRIAPLRCFADNCKSRFDNSIQLGDHIKLHHPQDARFLCAVCSKEFDSQHKAYDHWYKNHLTGQLQCNFVSKCTEVTDTRRKMITHQQVKHYSQLKHLHCAHPGCTASFSSNAYLKRHELTHLESNPFHCDWPHCSKQFNRRTNLITHIRMQHFGLPQTLKEQKAKNIVDLRDPNEYVRVVVNE